jgi:DNA-binding transcriptional LysR family regulator
MTSVSQDSHQLDEKSGDRLRARANLARFDLVTIRLAILCADGGSLAVAARQANMSKSNASQRLSDLESSVRTRLFARDHRGMHVTDAGTVFIDHGRKILKLIEDVSEKLEKLSACSPTSSGPLNRE